MWKVLSLAIGSLAVWLAGPALAESKKVAIASFGEHPALQLVIDGFKASMKERGYGDDKLTITFTHVNWERNLIPQMLTKIVADKPDVVVTITTPVSQTAVRALQDPAIPVVFAAVQDPVVAGLIPAWDKAGPNMTGASNRVDMDGTAKFIKAMIPGIKRLGVPYNPGDDADNALRKDLTAAAAKYDLELVMVGVDNANDIPQRLQTLAGKVDAIYVFPSNLFQPATAQIAAVTERHGPCLLQRSAGPRREERNAGLLLRELAESGRQCRGDRRSGSSTVRPSPRSRRRCRRPPITASSSAKSNSTAGN